MRVFTRSNHAEGRRSSRGLRAGVVLACLWLLVWCGAAQATVKLTVKALSNDAIRMEHVALRLDHAPDGRLALHLTAARVDMAALGWHRVGMNLHGVVTRTGARRWHFDGALALSGAPGGMFEHGQLQLTMDIDADTLTLAFAQRSTRVDAALPLDQPTHARIKLHNLPLRWLQGFLAGTWTGKLTGGRLSGVVAVDVTDGGMRSSGDLTLVDGGFDSADGKLAAQNLTVKGRVTLDTTTRDATLGADLALHGGQLLLGPLYTALPDHDVHLSLQAVLRRAGINLRDIRFTDPGTLHLAGSMGFGAQGGIDALHLRSFSANLAPAYTRYGKAWLTTLGFGNLAPTGHVEGSLWMDGNGLRAFKVNARQVDIAGARLAVDGLDGALDWQRGGDGPVSTLAWHKLGFYDIALGAAATHWQSRNGTLTLLEPLAVPVLGGQLHVRELAWNPQAGKGQHLQAALALTQIDVARLCAALGWPKFTGTLGGAIPGLRYVGDHIELDGGLTLSVFGGHVDVTRLAVQHPFGDVPVLSGDIHLQQLDLASLTGVFDFGRITGHLDGAIENLRLVNWKPVAFKASLNTTGDGGDISQRAVNNLTSVGGGGMASGLQGAVLKLFDNFGYRHIGISCTLAGSVCHMSGLEPVSGGGYLIVQGRGLPHLSVVGHQHEVSWPILVSRLKAAIQGGAPVVK